MDLSVQGATFKTNFNILGIIEPEKLAVKFQVNQKKYIFEKKKPWNLYEKSLALYILCLKTVFNSIFRDIAFNAGPRILS